MPDFKVTIYLGSLQKEIIWAGLLEREKLYLANLEQTDNVIAEYPGRSAKYLDAMQDLATQMYGAGDEDVANRFGELAVRYREWLKDTRTAAEELGDESALRRLERWEANHLLPIARKWRGNATARAIVERIMRREQAMMEAQASLVREGK